jgi:micrococcal nuclease
MYLKSNAQRPGGTAEKGRARNAGPRLARVLAAAAAVALLAAGPAWAQEEDAEREPPAGMTGPAEVRSGDAEAYFDGDCARVRKGDRVAQWGDCDDAEGDRPTTDDRPGRDEPTPSAAKPPEEKAPPGENTAPQSTEPQITVPAREPGVPSCPIEPPKGAEEATVERVVDGDTFELAEPVNGADTVRLIGADAPEIVDPDRDPEPYGEEASEFTKESLEGEEVLLLPGEDDKDGRLLAYAWLPGDRGSFNETLLREGYAELMLVEPNTRYKDCLEAAEADARRSGTGLHSAEAQTAEPETAALFEEQYDPRDPDSSAAEEPDAQEEPPAAPPDAPEPTDDETTPAAQEEERPSADAQEDQRDDDQRPREPVGEVTAEPTDVLAGDEQYDPRDPDSSTESTRPEPPDEHRDDARPPAEEVEAGLDAPALAVEPPEDCPGAVLVLEEFEAEGGGTTPEFDVEGSSFVVRAATAEDARGPLKVGISGADGELGGYEQDPGAFDTVVPEGPGSFTLDFEAAAEDAAVSAVVYDCAEDAGSEETATSSDETAPEAAAQREAEPRAAPAAPELPDVPETLPAEDEQRFGESPEAGVVAAAASPAGQPPAETVETLPVASDGAQPVLPDTGGPESSGSPVLALALLGVLPAGLLAGFLSRLAPGGR